MANIEICRLRDIRTVRETGQAQDFELDIFFF